MASFILPTLLLFFGLYVWTHTDSLIKRFRFVTILTYLVRLMNPGWMLFTYLLPVIVVNMGIDRFIYKVLKAQQEIPNNIKKAVDLYMLARFVFYYFQIDGGDSPKA